MIGNTFMTALSLSSHLRYTLYASSLSSSSSLPPTWVLRFFTPEEKIENKKQRKQIVDQALVSGFSATYVFLRAFDLSVVVHGRGGDPAEMLTVEIGHRA